MKPIEHFIKELNEELNLLLITSDFIYEDKWCYFDDLVTELNSFYYKIIQTEETAEIDSDTAFIEKTNLFNRINKTKVVKNIVARMQKYEFAARLRDTEHNLLDRAHEIRHKSKTEYIFFSSNHGKTIAAKKFTDKNFNSYFLSKLQPVNDTDNS